MMDRTPAKKSKEAHVLSQSDELALNDHDGKASLQHLGFNREDHVAPQGIIGTANPTAGPAEVR